MKQFTKSALLAVGVTVAAGAAHAQISPNDLILGFNQKGVSQNDYIIDLGNISSAVGVGGNQVVDLSSLINMSVFNTAFSGGPNGVAVGFAGGNNGVGTKDVFATQQRITLANPPSLSGSTAPQNPSSASFISTAAAAVNGVTPLGLVSSGTAPSWTTQVAAQPGDTTGTAFLNAISVNPMSTISGNSIVEDLYHDNRVGSTGQTGWAYDGYFTLTFSGPNTESLTFTPAAFVPVPEPTTYGLIAGAGLLAGCLRRQFRRKTA